jgi:hypothetical protein
MVLQGIEWLSPGNEHEVLSMTKLTLGHEDVGTEGDPLLECHQQGACHPPLFFTKIGLSGLRMKKEGLCGSRSKGECRLVLLAILWKQIFIARVDKGRFIELCWNKGAVNRRRKAFQESRRPCVTKWEGNSCGDHRRKKFPFY